MASVGGSVVVSQVPTPPVSGEEPASVGVQKVAMPLHVQMLQRALNVDRLISQVQAVLNDSQDGVRLNLQSLKASSSSVVPTNGRLLNIPKNQLYNFENVPAERKWVQELLLSDSDGSGSELSETEQLQIMLELQYKRRKKWRKRLRRDPKLLRYKYFSVGLLLKDDPYPEHVKAIEEKYHTHLDPSREEGVNKIESRQKLWSFIVKKEIPKMAKQFHTSRHNIITNNRKIAQLCQREVKKLAAKSQKVSKEASVQPRARRLMKEAMIYWRKYEKVEREQRRKAEKEAMEQRKLDDDMREAKKQQRKLNFLITQTELYAHFMAKKLTGEADLSDKILQKLDDAPLQREIRPGVVVNLEQPEDYDTNAIKARVLSNVQSAFKKHEKSNLSYKELARHGVGQSAVADEAKTDLQESFDKSFSLATPVLYTDKELPQPTIFKGKLKVYQLKGMNWLANLYDQGINGILADEMGLGKTVQSIAFLAHLAEHQRTWGPFLIVSPASTLHNWQQECTRFVPRFKVLPYWGSPHERKIIRKYWNQKLLYRENAPFHILITSYQLVVQDVKYFQRVKWQYMILDEAQAIKSSSSVRWKVLLSFNCRNRLLLTGTPIQNTMQELWALLHFIMPTMFDSHEEFNEWFSKDIESHAEKKSVLDEHQLSRLHLILKPFMLRRIKKDVEHEMAEKIEVHLSCDLSTCQRRLYDGLRKRISIEDLLQSSAAQAANSTRDSATSHLLNLVMQFRKVCNHPDLFERRTVTSPISVSITSLSIPTLVYHQVLCPSLSLHRLHTLTLGVHSTAHIHTSSQEERGCWSFLRLTNTTPQEANTVMLGSLAERLVVLMSLVERVHLVYQQRFWESNLSNSRSSRTQLLLWPSFTLSHTAQEYSPILRSLVFTSHTSTVYTHTTHHIYPQGTSSTELSKISSTVSDHATQQEETTETAENGESSFVKDGSHKVDSGSSPTSSIPCRSNHAKSLTPNNAHHSSNDQYSQHSITDSGTGEIRQSPPTSSSLIYSNKHTQYHCMLTHMPKFLVAYSPKVRVPWTPLYCSHRSAENVRQLCLSGGPPRLKDIMLHGCHKRDPQQLDILRSQELAGLDALKPPNGWSHIQIPDKENMIYDSGKMVVLDKLLAQLKRESHRVLIYSQMTRMIDLLEEFMSCRRYKYIRLDGSSKISDRRDMVADFQTNSEIFAFLLSTRAGGLGINLTAADTVIFYDSDWNPTVDQQAMDRAHRLGQTKQVTVYRLIVKGSIEERILQRAREKSEIQKMVISGGDFKPDTLKAKEMVSLLLDDDEMETRFLAKQAEKKAILDQQGKKNKNSRKRKTAPNGREGESLLKRPATGTGSGLVSNTPSPLMFSTRPDSVISVGSNSEIFNGDDSIDIVGSTDGSEVNSEISRQGGGGGTTPVRKLPGTRRTNGSGLGAKKTSAPLGGRGKMQRSSKKGGSGSAAASAGAMAGALAASSAAYAAYAAGYGLSPHQISPSPSNSGGSPGGAMLTGHHGNSVHSSPRVSPVPQAFVATLLITTPPTSKGTKNVPINNNITPKNNV